MEKLLGWRIVEVRSAYRFKKKLYQFIVNGRTGEVQGERPWSIAKIATLVVAILLAALGIYLLV